MNKTGLFVIHGSFILLSFKIHFFIIYLFFEMSFDNDFDSTCESRVDIDRQRDSVTSANEELLTTVKQRRYSKG